MIPNARDALPRASELCRRPRELLGRENASGMALLPRFMASRASGMALLPRFMASRADGMA